MAFYNYLLPSKLQPSFLPAHTFHRYDSFAGDTSDSGGDSDEGSDEKRRKEKKKEKVGETRGID